MVNPFDIAWNLLKQDSLGNLQGIPSRILFELAALGTHDPSIVEEVLGEYRTLTEEESMKLVDHAVAAEQKEDEARGGPDPHVPLEGTYRPAEGEAPSFDGHMFSPEDVERLS